MKYASIEEKNAFLSAMQKNLELVFDDSTTIDNEDIALENMNLEQTLCDETELRFGKISAACFKTRISASTKRYKGLWFNATIKAGEYERKLGRFQVYSDEMTSDLIYRDIVAYDALYGAMNTDVTEWYNGLTFPITQKAFRDSLFEFLGIEQEQVKLPNDNITFDKTVDAENFTGLKVLEALCEINAVWGVMNSNGLFKYVRMRTQEHDALYPSDDLYPSDNLYPNDIYDETLSRGKYYQGTLKYEEYDVKPISKVVIREDSQDVGYSYGEDGNTYAIQGNFLLYGASDEVLQTVAKNFFDYASYVSYTPSQLSCTGAPWREVGDLLKVIADKRTLTVPILSRRMSGITALKDIYVAKGTETYGENKNSTSEQIKQLQGRTNKLTRDLNGTRSEVAKKVNGEDVVSVINQSAEEILLKGNRVVIESDNFNLTKDGSIEMLSGTIKIEGTVRKYASDYTQDDLERANSISLGNTTPTINDLEKLDTNGDGVITILDVVRINRMLQGLVEYYDVPTKIEINPLNTQSILKTDGVSLGTAGAFFDNVTSENSYNKKIYVMSVGNGYTEGVSGSFTTADGKTVDVISGIITSIS